MEYITGGLYSVHSKEIDPNVEPQYVDFKHIVSIPLFYPQSCIDRTYKVSQETRELTVTYEEPARGSSGQNPFLIEQIRYLKPHVKEWLDKTLQPSTDRRRPLKWPYAAPGSPSVDLDIFFLRRRDAMHFMMVWAEYIQNDSVRTIRNSTEDVLE